MQVVVQAHRIIDSIVEGEVDIMGIVREDVLQVLTQFITQFLFGRIIQLGRYLSGNVGDKRQLVLNFRLADAVALVLVDH